MIKRLENLVILACEKAQKGYRKCSGFMICSYLKDSAFTATRLEKGVPFKFVNRGYTKGVPFLPKLNIKGYMVGPWGGAS